MSNFSRRAALGTLVAGGIAAATVPSAFAGNKQDAEFVKLKQQYTNLVKQDACPVPDTFTRTDGTYVVDYRRTKSTTGKLDIKVPREGVTMYGQNAIIQYPSVHFNDLQLKAGGWKPEQNWRNGCDYTNGVRTVMPHALATHPKNSSGFYNIQRDGVGNKVVHPYGDGGNLKDLPAFNCSAGFEPVWKPMVDLIHGNTAVSICGPVKPAAPTQPAAPQGQPKPQ